MKRYVVTGATGFVGSNLVKKLIEDGCEVLIIARKSSNLQVFNEIRSKIKIFVLNDNINDLTNVLIDFQPSLVYHLASHFVSEHNNEDVSKLINSNILFGSELLEAMKMAGVKNIINVGTSWQNYEDSNYNPVCLYAATKEAFEKIIEYYVKVENFKAITLRLFDTYGPHDNRKKIINLFKTIARTGESLSMSKGEQLIDMVYIDDVVNNFIEAVKLFDYMKNESKIYYVTSSYRLTLREIAKLFEEINDIKLNIQWGGRTYRKREVMRPYIPKKEEIIYASKWKISDGLKKVFNVDERGKRK